MTGSTLRIPTPETSVTRWQGAWLVVAVTIALASVSAVVARGRRQPRGAAPLTLMGLADLATRVEMRAPMVPFALHGFVRFETLNDLFIYIDEQAGRWTLPASPDIPIPICVKQLNRIRDVALAQRRP